MHILIVLFLDLLMKVILLYNKTIVDFYFGEHEVLLNSKLFILTDFASVNIKFEAEVNMKFTV